MLVDHTASNETLKEEAALGCKIEQIVIDLTKDNAIQEMVI